MKEIAADLASWASILGSAAALLGFLHSQTWMAIAGTGCAAISIGALVYARKHRTLLDTASVNIEGLNLDSLNVANLRRRLNSSLVVQRAFQLAKIDGRNLGLTWHYDGFCQSKRETTIEFSIDTENNIPFNELDCFAFDLQQDPERRHRIKPILIGSDGLSKKIALPFLKPLQFQQPFSVLLNCNLPGCVDTGVQYYTSSLSFAQRHIDRLAVHLVFVRRTPEWVRVYECDKRGRPALISELRPFKDDGETCEYVDLAESVAGQSVRIYVYQLSPSLRLPEANEVRQLPTARLR
jgi:hypothetical protein